MQGPSTGRVRMVLKQASDGAEAAAVRRRKPNRVKGDLRAEGRVVHCAGAAAAAAADTVSQKRRSDAFPLI